jgi:hypothetical protein
MSHDHDETDTEAIIGSILDHVETLVNSEHAARAHLAMAARSLCETDEEWQELVSLINRTVAAEPEN